MCGLWAVVELVVKNMGVSYYLNFVSFQRNDRFLPRSQTYLSHHYEPSLVAYGVIRGMSERKPDSTYMSWFLWTRFTPAFFVEFLIFHMHPVMHWHREFSIECTWCDITSYLACSLGDHVLCYCNSVIPKITHPWSHYICALDMCRSPEIKFLCVNVFKVQ